MSLLLLSLLSPSSASSSPQPLHTSSSSSAHRHCPPFPSAPTTFPFSSSPSCNHPSFQIHCYSPHCLLSINSLPTPPLPPPIPPEFPYPHSPPPPSPRCPPLPSHPNNLSSSAFHLLSNPCPNLTSLCQTPIPSSCNLSSLQSHLLSSPHLLFPHCKPKSSSNYVGDASNVLSMFLHTGFSPSAGTSPPTSRTPAAPPATALWMPTTEKKRGEYIVVFI